MRRQPGESKIQNVVYGLDMGGGLRILRVAGAVLFLVILMLVYTATQFKGLKEADAMDSAQLGRNLLTRHAYITQCVRPASMGTLMQSPRQANPRILNHPDLYHPPVYPTLLAMGFRLFPSSFAMERPGGTYVPEQWVIIPINHIFFLLSGLMLYLIARELFGSIRALWVILVFILSDLMWADSISGTGLTVVMFFLLSGYYFAVLAGRMLDANRALAWKLCVLLSTLSCGLAVLTRYAAAAMVPGVLLYLAVIFGRRRWIVPVLFGLGVLLCIAPWTVRNIRICGKPFGLAPQAALYDSNVSEGDSLERKINTPITAGAALGAVQRKFVARLGDIYQHKLLGFGEGLIFPFFLASFFFRFVRRDVNLFRWSIGLSVLGICLAAAVFTDDTLRLLHLLWPLIILYGLAFFFLLLDRMQIRLNLLRIGVILLTVLLSAAPLIITLLPPGAGVPYPPYYPPFITLVSRVLEPNEVMATDMPWATAWYGNRASIYLPQSIQDFYEINDNVHHLSGLYFTTLTRDKPYIRELKTGPYQSWFPILEGRLPNDFPLVHGRPLNNLDQIFLTDRPRWGQERPK